MRARRDQQSVDIRIDADGDIRIAAYFGEPSTRRRFAALRLMRIMSDFREGMWGVVQTAISTLDFDFAGYADEHFERMEQTAAEPAFRRALEG